MSLSDAQVLSGRNAAAVQRADGAWEVLQFAEGAMVVRTLPRDTPAVLYSAADEIADFGTPQASLSVAVYQLSATVGRGTAGTAILAVS